MGVRLAKPSGSEAWIVPLALVGGAGVGLLLGVFVGAVAEGIGLGAALGLVAGAVAAGVTRTAAAEGRMVVLWVTLTVLVAGSLAMVLTWLR